MGSECLGVPVVTATDASRSEKFAVLRIPSEQENKKSCFWTETDVLLQDQETFPSNTSNQTNFWRFFFFQRVKEVDFFAWQFRQNTVPVCLQNSERKTGRLFTDMARKKKNADKYWRLKVTLSPEFPPDLEQQWAQSEQFCQLQCGDRQVKLLFYLLRQDHL